jgi:hypothetical protein
VNSLARENSLIDPFRSLNPEKIDFTFIPNIQENTNRSRLDFFLISEHLIDKCKNSLIGSSLTSKLFDHKPVMLDFKKRIKKQRDKIKDTILKDELLGYHVHATVFDSYVNHAVINENFTLMQKINLQTQIGLIMTKLLEIQNLKLNAILENTDNLPEFELLINAKKNIVINLCADLPQLFVIENLSLDCSAENFLEVLVMQIKSTCLSFQSFYFRSLNMKKDQLKTSLTALKNSYHANQQEIRNKENLLANIVDQELKDELSLLKNFIKI